MHVGALMVMVLALAAVGCGGDEGRQPPSPPSQPAPEVAVEAAPAVALSALVPAEFQRGTGFTVDDPVPTDGLMAHFTLRSDDGALEVGMPAAWVAEAAA